MVEGVAGVDRKMFEVGWQNFVAGRVAKYFSWWVAKNILGGGIAKYFVDGVTQFFER